MKYPDRRETGYCQGQRWPWEQVQRQYVNRRVVHDRAIIGSDNERLHYRFPSLRCGRGQENWRR